MTTFTFTPVKPYDPKLVYKSKIINIKSLIIPARIEGRVKIKPIILAYKYSKEDSILKARKIANKHRARVSRIKKANEDILTYRAISLLNGARTRAKQKNIECTITFEWLYTKLLEGHCAVTKLPFIFTRYGQVNQGANGKYKTNHNAPSLDQIRPSEGYTPQNTQVVLSAFNKFKSDTEQYKLYKIANAFCKEHMNKRRFRVAD